VLVSTAQNLPIGAAVCAANRQDASFTGEALAGVVVSLPVNRPLEQNHPPQQKLNARDNRGRIKRSSVRVLEDQLHIGQDLRVLPYLRADGNFAKIPARH
jgi:hypothetical protein